jgi:hypothetical protein
MTDQIRGQMRGRCACGRAAWGGPIVAVATVVVMGCGASGHGTNAVKDAGAVDQLDAYDLAADPLSSPNDADIDGSVDVGSLPFPAPSLGPVVTCNPASPFAPPRLIEGFWDPGVQGPNYAFTFSPDLLTLFVVRLESPLDGFTVFRASRASLQAPFGALQPSLRANGLQAPLFLFMSDDNLRLFTSTYIYTRSSATQPDFDMTRGFDSLLPNVPFWVSADQKRIYFGGADVTMADLADLTISSPRPIASLNSSSEGNSPVLTRDELTIYFSSLRPRGAGEPSWDIYMAKRAKVSDDFGAPQLVPELSTNAQERINYVSPEGCTVYLFRYGGPGGDQNLQASRGP